MSMRQPANRSHIEEFLRRLGARFHRPGKVYLVGGTTLVYEGFREQSIDVDLVYDVAPEVLAEFVQTIRELKDQLTINVEETSPGDFIPLPLGYKERAIFIRRFGQLDVFHFDLYSTALSKIARGTEEDLSDVIALFSSGRIGMASLEKYFAEIKPRIATESLKQNPIEFESNFQALRRRLAD